MNIQNLIETFITGFNSEKTQTAYRKDVMFFVNQAKLVNPSDITTDKIIEFRDLEKERGSAPASVARRLSSLRSFCSFLISKKQLQSDVFLGIAKTKIYKVRPTEACTDAEIIKMIKTCDKQGTLRDRVLIRVLFQLGVRREEASQIKRSDVYEYEAGNWAITVVGKGEKQRSMALKKDLVEMILKLDKKEDELVFGISGTSINDTVKKFAKLSGIKKRITAHSCRASVISHLLENGESPRNVADMVGHANINTTIGYDKKRDGLKNSSALKVGF